MKQITETKKQIAHAKSIHGNKYRYKRIKGTSPWLYKLKDCQAVCAGGDTWHILMTEKPYPQSKRNKCHSRKRK